MHFPCSETAQELDVYMRKQWSSGKALDRTYAIDFDGIRPFFLYACFQFFLCVVNTFIQFQDVHVNFLRM